MLLSLFCWHSASSYTSTTTSSQMLHQQLIVVASSVGSTLSPQIGWQGLWVISGLLTSVIWDFFCMHHMFDSWNEDSWHFLLLPFGKMVKWEDFLICFACVFWQAREPTVSVCELNCSSSVIHVAVPEICKQTNHDNDEQSFQKAQDCTQNARVTWRQATHMLFLVRVGSSQCSWDPNDAIHVHVFDTTADVMNFNFTHKANQKVQSKRFEMIFDSIFGVWQILRHFLWTLQQIQKQPNQQWRRTQVQLGKVLLCKSQLQCCCHWQWANCTWQQPVACLSSHGKNVLLPRPSPSSQNILWWFHWPHL